MPDVTIDMPWLDKSDFQVRSEFLIAKLDAAKAVLAHVETIPRSVSGLDDNLQAAYDAALKTLAETLGD